jgi:hypothetical protein
MVYKDDLIYLYVDFIPITSTVSPDDALALLIGMYSIFELCFNKNSRTIRFLYSFLHGDKRFLSNSIRIFIKDNNIDIYAEKTQQQSTRDMETSSISRQETTRRSDSVLDSASNLTGVITTHSSQDDVDSSLHIVLNTQE